MIPRFGHLARPVLSRAFSTTDPLNIVPTVIDKTGKGERAYDIYSRLLKERIICVMGGIEDYMASSVIAQLLFLQSKNTRQPIHMYIDSPGRVDKIEFRCPSTAALSQKQNIDDRQNLNHKKLIYEGKLSNRILYLKSLSILSTVGLTASYGYAISQKGISIGLAGVGFAFTPFLVSPFIIAWFFKRYITHLYYDALTDTYTAHHYGLLLTKRSCTFKRDDVTRSDVTSMLNTFTVGTKPFFLHDEDLMDLESIELYKQMIGLKQGEKMAWRDAISTRRLIKGILAGNACKALAFGRCYP